VKNREENNNEDSPQNIFHKEKKSGEILRKHIISPSVPLFLCW